MKNMESVSALKNRLEELEHSLEESYSQLGKHIMELTYKEQIGIDNIVNEIVCVRKKLSDTTQ